jgi:hypothetical protein
MRPEGMINMGFSQHVGVHQKKGVTPRVPQAERQLPKGPWLAQRVLISALNASEEELTQVRGVIDEALSNEFHRIDVEYE